jgi:hypothetical protein
MLLVLLPVRKGRCDRGTLQRLGRPLLKRVDNERA